MFGRATKEVVEPGGFQVAVQRRRHPQGAEQQDGKGAEA